MIFSIRDDDTNFFTKPADLEEAYSEIWDICPITLFIVPYMMGNWKKWIVQRYHNYDQVNLADYKNDDKIFPIGDNEVLVSYLKNKIKEGRIDIGIHGINHKNIDDESPVIESNRGENAEFFTTQDFSDKLKDAKAYLENLFDMEIKVFSPPQNLINSNGVDAVYKSGLSIVQNRNRKEVFKNVNEIGIINTIKILRYSILKIIFKKKQKRFPKELFFRGNYVIEHYPFQPKTKMYDLKRDAFLANKNNDIFVLSTHYYALQQSFDSSSNMKRDLLELLLELVDKSNVKFMGVNELIKLKSVK